MGVVQICRRTQEFRALAKPPTNARILRLPSVRPGKSSLPLRLPVPVPSPRACSLSVPSPRACSLSAPRPLLNPCLSAARPTFPRRGRLFVVIDSSASRSRHPGVPSSSVPQCDNPNTMIDLDDKENQSPLRLGFNKSPSPKRSRNKNTASAGQDVSDAPSKQSPSQSPTLVVCHLGTIADLVTSTVGSSFRSQVYPPVQTR